MQIKLSDTVLRCFHFRTDVDDIPKVSGIEDMSKKDIVQWMLEDYQEREKQDDNYDEREEQDPDYPAREELDNNHQEREEQDEEQDFSHVKKKKKVNCQSVVSKFYDYDDNLA